MNPLLNAYVTTYHCRRSELHDWVPITRRTAARLAARAVGCYLHLRGNRHVYQLRSGGQMRIVRRSANPKLILAAVRSPIKESIAALNSAEVV